ncbi:HTH-type transcriptional activator RhaS [Methylobacterium frigidaeris]|uniref:HTH-type transcriptional activator RhaS n=3 Tax=Methylobacterium frigidaeris TaxID=2038277 RepID=A0AA37HJ02_9HYPH|nr:HTH-type transcriptional activator RhaS [Methylobacterium frigidaeris]
MLKGVYIRHAYPWHAHEDLCLGTVVGGAVQLRTRDSGAIASAGTFVLINSDELHCGWPAADEGWRCRTIHVHAEVLQAVADECRIIGKGPTLYFKGPAFEDAELSRHLLDLHCRSEIHGSALERQSLFFDLISCLIERHARASAEPQIRDKEPRAVALAREFLDQNLSDKVTLEELALAVGLTPFRLLRSFRKATGLTPHQYQFQARVRQAHGRLRRNEPLADIAAAVGFADQAHMTRAFKAVMGGTPGQFRMFVATR